VQVAQTITTPKSKGVSPSPEKPVPAQAVTAAVQEDVTTGESGADLYKGMPMLVKDTEREKKGLEPPYSSNEPPMLLSAQLSEEEARRLSSETRRLLLCHQEHAMTLAELVESFVATGDPAGPNPESLYQALLKHGGSIGDGNTRFEVCFN
jgi:hypothetical protein